MAVAVECERKYPGHKVVSPLVAFKSFKVFLQVRMIFIEIKTTFRVLLLSCAMPFNPYVNNMAVNPYVNNPYVNSCWQKRVQSQNQNLS